MFWNKINPCGSDDTQALNRQVHSMGYLTFAEASNARANAFTQGFWRIRSSNLRPPLGVRHFLTELNFDLSPTTGFGRKLSEPKAVVLGELAQMPKAPFVGDIGDLQFPRNDLAELVANAVQAVSLHESGGRQAVAFHESMVQRSLARSGDTAERSEGQCVSRPISNCRDCVCESLGAFCAGSWCVE